VLVFWLPEKRRAVLSAICLFAVVRLQLN